MLILELKNYEENTKVALSSGVSGASVSPGALKSDSSTTGPGGGGKSMASLTSLEKGTGSNGGMGVIPVSVSNLYRSMQDYHQFFCSPLIKTNEKCSR